MEACPCGRPLSRRPARPGRLRRAASDHHPKFAGWRGKRQGDRGGQDRARMLASPARHHQLRRAGFPALVAAGPHDWNSQQSLRRQSCPIYSTLTNPIQPCERCFTDQRRIRLVQMTVRHRCRSVQRLGDSRLPGGSWASCRCCRAGGMLWGAATLPWPDLTGGSQRISWGPSHECGLFRVPEPRTGR
jgi:hypothetical protein